jgi:hypothetical protein
LFSFAQVGDNTTTDRNTPVSVAGLSSGVAMVALGEVSRFCELCTHLVLARERGWGVVDYLCCYGDVELLLREIDFGKCIGGAVVA